MSVVASRAKIVKIAAVERGGANAFALCRSRVQPVLFLELRAHLVPSPRARTNLTQKSPVMSSNDPERSFMHCWSQNESKAHGALNRVGL
jgi:hypothetical protein